MKKLLTGVALLGLASLALVGAGCSDKNPLAAFEPEIVNTADNFQFQATGVTNVSTVLTYSWENSGTRATIDHSSAVADGTTRLQILDADGVEVYSDSLRASVQHESAAGQAGTWTVRVTLQNVDGTLNFRAEML